MTSSPGEPRSGSAGTAPPDSQTGQPRTMRSPAAGVARSIEFGNASPRQTATRDRRHSDRRRTTFASTYFQGTLDQNAARVQGRREIGFAPSGAVAGELAGLIPGFRRCPANRSADGAHRSDQAWLFDHDGCVGLWPSTSWTVIRWRPGTSAQSTVELASPRLTV